MTDAGVALRQGAPVAVYAVGSSTLASLYTDRTKAAPAVNPAAVGSLGNLTIFAEPGVYELDAGFGRVRVVVAPDVADLGATGPPGGGATGAQLVDLSAGAAGARTADLSSIPSSVATALVLLPAGDVALTLILPDGDQRGPLGVMTSRVGAGITSIADLVNGGLVDVPEPVTTGFSLVFMPGQGGTMVLAPQPMPTGGLTRPADVVLASDSGALAAATNGPGTLGSLVITDTDPGIGLTFHFVSVEDDELVMSATPVWGDTFAIGFGYADLGGVGGAIVFFTADGKVQSIDGAGSPDPVFTVADGQDLTVWYRETAAICYVDDVEVARLPATRPGLPALAGVGAATGSTTTFSAWSLAHRTSITLSDVNLPGAGLPDLALTGTTLTRPIMVDPPSTVGYHGGPALGACWAVVGATGRYSTPDVGAFDGTGIETRFLAVALAHEDNHPAGDFMEVLTQYRTPTNSIDLDNYELALRPTGTDEVAVFHEFCRIDTPFVVAGEYALGRCYSVPDGRAREMDYVDRAFRLAYGEPFEGLHDLVFDRGDGKGQNSIYRRVSGETTRPDDVVTSDGNRWRLVVRRVMPDVASLADAGTPWIIGTNGGLWAVSYLTTRYGFDGPLRLSFDASDATSFDGDIDSSGLPGQTWTRIAGSNGNGPVVVDTRLRSLAEHRLSYTPANSGYWNGAPATDRQALDRLAAVVSDNGTTPIP